MHASPYFDTCVWEVWQYCAAPLAVLQYEEAGRRYPGTGRTGHEYSSTDTWPYHSVSPCQVWQYGADFLMYPSIASHLWRTDTLYPTWPCPLIYRTLACIDHCVLLLFVAPLWLV